MGEGKSRTRRKRAPHRCEGSALYFQSVFYHRSCQGDKTGGEKERIKEGTCHDLNPENSQRKIAEKGRKSFGHNRRGHKGASMHKTRGAGGRIYQGGTNGNLPKCKRQQF